MTQDLLAKEKEFHRLNRELSEKTKDLMRQVDDVLLITRNETSAKLLNSHDSRYRQRVVIDDINNPAATESTLTTTTTTSESQQNNDKL